MRFIQHFTRLERAIALGGGMVLLGLIAAVIFIRSELRLREYVGTISTKNEQLKTAVDKLNRSVTGSRLRAVQSRMQTARSLALRELENVQSFPAENRRFAWKLLHRMAYDEVQDLTDLGGGFGAIHRLWFSPDDSRLIAGSKPHFLSIIDLSQQERIDVPDAMRIVGPTLFPPGSQSFYGQQWDGDLLEVSLESGEILRRLSLPISIRPRMVLTSDGRLIAGLTLDGHAFVYEISSGELQVSDETMPSLTAGIWLTPNDRVLNTVNRRGDWYQWQLDDLSLLKKTPLKDVAAMGDGFPVKDGRVCAAEATYDAHGGFCIAVAFESGMCCPVWPGNESRIPVLARSSSATTHFSFRPPSSCMCPDHEGGLLFSLTDPGAQQRLRPPEHSVLATAVSHDGYWLATGGSHGALTLSRSPDHSTGPKVLGAFTNQFDRGYGPPVCTIPLGNAGNVLICHREGWMAAMDVAESKTREAFQVAASRFSVAAFSGKHQLAVFGFQMPDGCVVAHRYRADGTFCEPVCAVPADSDTRTESVVALEAQEVPIRPAPAPVFRTDFNAHVSSVCFSHDEQHLIVGLRNGELLRLDVETGSIQQHWCRPTMLSSGPATITSVCSVTDGVLCGGIDGRIQWRRLSDGKVIREWQAHDRLIRCLVVDERRRTIFSGAADGQIGIFDFNGRLLHRMVGHHDRVISLALSPDGETLASGSHDHHVILWDAVAGEQQLVLNNHNHIVTGLQFADDECLYSTSRDGTVLVWDVANEFMAR